MIVQALSIKRSSTLCMNPQIQIFLLLVSQTLPDTPSVSLPNTPITPLSPSPSVPSSFPHFIHKCRTALVHVMSTHSSFMSTHSSIMLNIVFKHFHIFIYGPIIMIVKCLDSILNEYASLCDFSLRIFVALFGDGNSL